jgi:hypothetical protein
LATGSFDLGSSSRDVNSLTGAQKKKLARQPRYCDDEA